MRYGLTETAAGHEAEGKTGFCHRARHKSKRLIGAPATAAAAAERREMGRGVTCDTAEQVVNRDV